MPWLIVAGISVLAATDGLLDGGVCLPHVSAGQDPVKRRATVEILLLLKMSTTTSTTHKVSKAKEFPVEISQISY